MHAEEPWTSFPGHCCGGSAAKNRDHEVMLLVSEKDIDALALSPDEFPSRKLRLWGCLRYFRRRFLGSLAALLKAYHFAGLYIASSIRTPFWAWAGSLPRAVLAGRFRGIPTFIHESNAVLESKRWTARAVNA